MPHEFFPGSFGELKARFLAAQERSMEESKRPSDFTFEEFMESPAMGFAGSGIIKSIRGLIGTGAGLQLRGREVFKPGFGQEGKVKLTSKRAPEQQNRPIEFGTSPSVKMKGGRRPPGEELFRKALKVSKPKSKVLRKGFKVIK